MEARAEVFEQIYPNAQYPPNTILVVNRLVEERLLIEIEAVVAVPGGR
jgi:enamine deaminase RidA (YjgF/YER057c/UK114 family)